MGKTEEKPDLSPLWEAYREGGRIELRNQLIELNYHLVAENVRRFVSSITAVNIDFEDIISAAEIGLMQAVEKFDPSLGFNFATYADRRIHGEILDSLRSLDWIPRRTRDLMEACKKTVENMEKAGNFEPSAQEVAEYLKASVQMVEWVMKHIRMGTLTYFLRQGGAAESGDPRMFSRNFSLIADPKSPDPVEEMMEKEKFDDWFRPLPRENKAVMNLYYRDGLTLKKIGEALGMSESNACLIMKQSIGILRAVYMPQNAA